MSELENLLKTHYAGINAGDLDTAVSVFDPDCETVTPDGPLKGLEAFRAMGEAFRTAAPDNHIEAVRTFEAGDTIIVEGTYSGTHTGPLLGVAATGRRFEYAGAAFFTVEDGRLASAWVLGDLSALRRQLTG